MNRKTAFITGATSGIGEACARRFALGGYNVIITGRNKTKLEQLKNDLTKVSHLPFYWLSRIIKHCNILIDILLTFRK